MGLLNGAHGKRMKIEFICRLQKKYFFKKPYIKILNLCRKPINYRTQHYFPLINRLTYNF